MAELQKLLQSNVAFKSELMQEFLSSSSGSSSLSLSPGPQSQSLGGPVDNTQFIDNGNSLHGNTQTTTSTGATPTPSTDSTLANTDPCGNVKTSTESSQKTTSASNLTGAGPVRDADLSDPNANEATAVQQLLEKVERPLSATQQLLIDQVTDAVVQGHLATCSNTYARVAEANERLARESQGMPDLSQLSLTASAMWQQFTANMSPEIAKAVTFCKGLPGFAEIEQEDQMNLIKQGSFEVMLARFSMLVDHVSEEMMDPGHKMKCPKEVILAMPMGPFLKEFFSVAACFNPLKLTDGEIGLFTSILFICPERMGLKSKETIGKVQFLLLQALYSLMKKNHAEPGDQFVKLLNTIPVIRAINEKHSKALSSMKMKSPASYSEQFPTLHREVFN